MLLVGMDDAGNTLDATQCRRLFDLAATTGPSVLMTPEVRKPLDEAIEFGQTRALEDISTRNAHWFDLEMEKLDRWAEDLKDGVEREIKELEIEIKAAKREARQAPSLEQKVSQQRQVKEMERKLKEKRKQRDEAQDDIESQKDSLLEEIEAKLAQDVERTELFAIRWRIS